MLRFGRILSKVNYRWMKRTVAGLWELQAQGGECWNVNLRLGLKESVEILYVLMVLDNMSLVCVMSLSMSFCMSCQLWSR